MSTETPEYLLWLDFETTGLDTSTAEIIEVAAVVTRADDQMYEIDGYETLVWTLIPPPDWDAFEFHEGTGLLADWLCATTDDAAAWPEHLGDAEDSIVGMLDGANLTSASVTLAGSGVGTFDLPLIRRLMPNLAKRLTYHVHDVGVMRRAYRRAVGADLTPRTEPAHRAMADVQQSLTEGRAFADLFRYDALIANRFMEASHEAEAEVDSLRASNGQIRGDLERLRAENAGLRETRQRGSAERAKEVYEAWLDATGPAPDHVAADCPACRYALRLPEPTSAAVGPWTGPVAANRPRDGWMRHTEAIKPDVSGFEAQS